MNQFRFWDRSKSGSRINFSIFSTLRDRVFKHCAGFLMKLLMNVQEIFWRGRSWDKEQLINGTGSWMLNLWLWWEVCALMSAVQ